MKHVGAYGMGTRALALLMALLMMLSTGGFALRDGTEPQPEPMAEVPAEPVSEQVPAPSEDVPAPSEDAPAPSEDVPAPSEDVPAPSEDAPAPSEDVPAPSEDVPAPSEDTPAPSEDTPVPSEDTPAPSDDPANGENASVGGVEPAPAETDPAEADPAATIEPSATPEPTADPNAGIMTVAAATSTVLQFAVTYDASSQKVTLTVTAVDNDVTGNSNGVKISWSGDNKPKWDAASGLGYSAGNSDAYILNTSCSSQILTKGQSATFTANVTGPSTYQLTFRCDKNMTGVNATYNQDIKVVIGGDNTVKIQKSDGTEVTGNGVFTIDFASSSGDGINPGTGGEPAPGPGTNGDTGDDTELTGTYNIIYHLNSPKGDDKTIVVSDDSNDTFVVENLQKGAVIFDKADVGDNFGKGGNYSIEKYYFAGWDKDQIGKDNFPGYDDIDYPITYIPTSGDEEGHRLILGEPTVTASESVSGKESAVFKEDLYAVWAPESKAGLIGYSMNITDARLGGEFVNGIKEVGSTVPQKLGNNGLSAKGAQKYSVLDDGWNGNVEYTVTDAVPTADGYVFVGWFNKSPNGSDYIVRPGKKTVRSSTTKGVYSLDALWGNLTPGNEVYVVYDGEPHSATFQGADGSQENPDVNLTPGTDTYNSYSNAKNALQEILKRKVITVDGTAYDPATGIQKQTAPGVYTYTVNAKVAVPNIYYADNKSTEGETELEFDTTTATLTIYPVLDLTVNKTVTGATGAPTEEFTFTVTPTGDNVGNVQFSKDKTGTLTATAGGNATTQMYFTADGTYTITVSENKGATPGMTYADAAQTVTVKVEGMKITEVNGASITSTSGYIGNGKAELTFTNTYGTGSLTVSKTVDGSAADQTKDFTFTVTLDPAITGEYGGMAFSGGVATFTLKHNGTVTATGLPAGVTYTVTETAADGFTATSTGETGKIEANKTAEAKFTNTHDVRLIYHLNVKDLADATVTDADPKVNGSSYTYTLKELNQAFPKKTDEDKYGASSYNANGGSITVKGTTYYFAGWAKDSTAKAYGEVDYPAWSPKSDTCELMGTPTLTTTNAKEDLYAIWSTNQALLGYTMTIKGGDFANQTQTDGQKLGDNGTAGSGAKKYVVLDDGYNYEDDKDTAITITSEVPTDSDNAYTFLGWYNKQYDNEYKKGSYNGANPNNKGKPFTFPGGKIYFGNTNTVFSLDAVWGRVTMDNVNVPYDGKEHAVETPSFEFQGGGDLLKGDLAKYADVNYTVTAQRRGDGDPKTTKSETAISSYGDIELPTYTDPGVYDYTLEVTYAPKDDGHGGEPQTLTATATLTIYPQLDLTVEKELQNGNINVIGNYSFTVEAAGAEISNSTLKVNVHAEGQDQASTKLWFPNPGTYTVTVTENKLAETVAPGVTFAQPQSFTVTVGSDYKISAITPTANGTIDAIGNATAALTFVNTYSGGDLVVTKRIENSGASVGTQQKFHFKVDLHNTNITTKLNGNGEMVFTNGVAEFDLANGGSMRATALPAGLNYTITETPVTGYETTYTVNGEPGGSGTTCEGSMAAGGATVVFTNTYTQVGKLTVTKTVTGDGAPAGDSFQFLLTLTDASGKPLADRQVGSVHLDEHGQYGFNLKAGETMTFTGLPTGTKYTVQEQNVPVGYTVTPANASGEIGHHNAVSEATFTNTYQTGDLKITKTVAVGGNTQHPFNITIAAVALVGRTFTMEKSDGTTGSVTFAAPGGTAMVTLKHDESVTIKDLPAGATYTVSEPGADSLGYDVAYSGGYTGTDSGTIAAGENTVTVTNTYRGGSLTITKNVTGTGAPEGAEFTFTVTLSDKTVNGPRGTYIHKGDASTPINFTSGVATLTLSHGESATIPGLPAGASYTVTEADVGAQGYTTTSTGSTGTIQKGGTVTAAFTNDYHPGRLIVTKTVTSIGADPNKTYHFKVELENKTSCNDKHGEMQFTNGVAEFDLKDGGTISADGLYTNTKIKITETTDPDYETSVGGKVLADGVYECTIPVGGTHAVTAAFINRYKTGDLTVSKTVAGVGADVHRAFGFTVTLSDKSITGAYGGMTFANGTATFTLTSGSSLTATGLPAGTTYTVTETEADQHGYKTTSTGATGAIEDQKTATAAFTNTYESGSLAVTKTVTGQGSQQRDFHILVTLGDKTVNGQYGGMNFTGGVASFTLRHGQSATATGLPAGVTYEVAERWATDYTPTYTNGTGTIMKGQTAQVTVTNAYPGGSLKIAKTVIGEGAPEGAEFHFTVTLSDSGVNGPRGEVDFTDGVAELTLRGGESADIQGLRAGTTYTVTETDADQNDYETTSTGATGAIVEGQTAAAAFTNRYCPGSLTITKTVDGGDTSRRFTFTVTLSDKTFTGARGGVTFTNGVSTKIYLANGESATLNRLPLGGYTVTEAEANRDGYETTVNGTAGVKASGELTAAQTHGTAAFTNRFKRGSLTVSKTVAVGEKDKDFTFTVTLSKPMTGTFGGVEFKDGTATFTLRDGQSVTAADLPDGIGYEVTESPAPGFTTTATGAKGTISDGKTAVARFTNTRSVFPKLTLTVEKQLKNWNNNVIGDYSFTVTSDPETVTITKPDLKVNVYSAAKLDSADLTFPAPGTYTVTVSENKMDETVAPGVEFAPDQSFAVTVGEDYKITTITPAETGTVDTSTGNAAVKLTFVNDYNGGDLVVRKTIENNGAGTRQSFHFKVDLHNTNINTKLNGNGEMVFTNGVAEFDLTNGGSMKATALPAGLSYTVTETDAGADGYAAAYTVDGTSATGTEYTGNIHNGENTVAFTNTYTKVGRLTVTKTVTGTGAPAGDSFQFLLTLTDANGQPLTGSYGGVAFDDQGTTPFTLKASESKTFTGLPSGTHYEVKETDVPVGYAVTSAGDSGYIPENNQAATADFTNDYRTGELTITKTVDGGGNQYHKFAFTVYLDGFISGEFPMVLTGVTETTGTLHFENGESEMFYLQAADGALAGMGDPAPTSITIKDLPAGIQYWLVEEPYTEYKPSFGEGCTLASGYTRVGIGTINAGPNLATVNNHYTGGNLDVTKKVTVDPASGRLVDPTETFNITVTLDTTVKVDGPRGYIGEDTNKFVTFKDNVATFDLHPNETAHLQGLPNGARYTVTEDEDAASARNYVVRYENGTGVINDDAEGVVSNKATVENSYQPGTLRISKTVAGVGADKTKAYSFTITQVGHSECNHGAEVHGVAFTNGVAHVTLKDGGHVDLKGLYANSRVTIQETEANQNGYETTVNGQPVDADGSYTVEIGNDRDTFNANVNFVNTYKTGSLTVSKTVVDRPAGRLTDFHFTVTAKDASGAPIQGAFGDMTFDANGQYTFALHDGGSESAENLPDGTQFTVTETEADQHGYRTTVNGAAYPAGGFTGAIEYKDPATAAFTNTYESGSLAVTKTVTGGGNLYHDFSIRVTLDDETVNGQYGEMKFAAGAASFTLRHGQTVTAEKLPAGVGYTVTEIRADDYKTTYTNQTGTITKGQTAQVTVTNAYPGGGLKITKTVIGEGAPTGDEFHFTVSLSDSGVNGPRGEVDFTDGVAELTLRGGESADIQGLRAGTTYTVTETDADRNGYETTFTGATGTIAKGQTAAADFTNRYCPGSLTVTKTVDGGDTSRQFTFTVTLSDNTFTGDRSGIAFEGGQATFPLTNGGHVTFDRLPLGGYTVTEAEADQDGYATTATGASGTLSATQPDGTAAFTNRFKRGGLTVAKTVDGTEADKQKAFDFTVTLSDTTVTGVYGDMSFTGGVAAFALHDGQSVTATDLPDGIGYVVTEEDTDPNFTVTATGAEGTVSDGTTAEARFTNTHKTGSLSVSKEVTLAARGDEDRAFQFTVTLSDNTVNGTYGVSSTAMTFENGVATFGLKNDDSKTATDLPAGVTATVTEADAEGYATTVNGEPYGPAAGVTVTVPQSGSAELRFVNRYTQSGDLSLTKQVAGDGADPDREFSFMVLVGNGTLNGGYGGMTFARGTAIVTLRAGETVTATGLPAGMTYTIYEDAATGYTATVNGQSYDPMSGVTGTIPGDNATETVAFTNTYQTGDLTIAKTVNGSGNQYAEFHFTLTLSDDYIGGEFQTSNGPLSFLDGVAGFDLSAGQSITIHGLPAGVGYTLEEDPADDYEPTITNGVGVIAAGPNQVDVVNHYTGGNLKITKQVAGTGADPNAAFDFTLRLPNHPINGPRGGVTFVNGVATFTLKGGQSVEVLGLPNGAEYVVEEDAAKAGDMGYLVGYPANAHGYIQDNEAGQYTAEVVVTNTYAPGDLVIAKRVTGAGADPDKEYHFTVTIEGGCSHGNIHGLTFENGVATFTLKDGQSQEIKHLREDAALTITEGEANADGYVTTVNGQPYNGGYIVDLSQDVDHAATAVFENHRANGNLTVTKAVVDAPAGRRPVFNFTVTLSDETINGTFGNGQTGMTFTNGIASFALADGQSRTATGLPANVTYTVTETNVTGYTAASTGAAGVIEDGKTATAAFTNTYHYGDLTVTDAVTGQGNIYHSFPITVTLNDDAINGTYGGMRFTNGTATFALTGAPGSNTMTTKSLPAGVRYTVTELTENQDGYTTTYDKNRTGPIIENVPARTDIINYYPGGGLTVSKTVTGAGADPDAAFHFTVTVYQDSSVDTAVTGPRGECSDGTPVTFSNGTASLVLKNGQSAAIKGLPAGDTYTVREREANQGGYVTTITGGTEPAAPVVAAGTITDNGNAEAAFTNAYQPGSLTVTKTVEGTDADKQKEFTFTVTLADKTFAGATGGVTFTDGQASFTLTDGQSVTFEGLPLGGYTVAEEPVVGYETTVNGQKAQSISGELTDQGRVEASFINRYIASDLTVTNTVQGEGADLTKPFTFTVTLNDDTVTGQYGGMTFTAGVAAFTLKHGESLTATGLPAVPATVVESDRDGYTTSVTSAQLSRAAAAPEDQATIDVTLAEGARTQVDFVNEIKPVPAEPTEPAEPTPTESTPAEPTPAEPTPTEPTPTEPTPTATEPAEPTPVATATPTPVTATAVPTAPNTGDEARPVLWAALLALSALGLGAVLTLRRKKHD